MEIWKEIDDSLYEKGKRGYVYSISNKGKVRNDTLNKLLNGSVAKDGYQYVTFCTQKFVVHRLVGIHFIDNPQNYPIINHIDGNKLNNVVENLEWCDDMHNTKEAQRIGLMTEKVKDADVEYIRTSTLSHRKMAKEMNISKSYVIAIRKGYRK